MEGVFLYMQDYDNADLPDGAWQAQLEDAVEEYNCEHDTDYDPYNTFIKYCQWLNKQDM